MRVENIRAAIDGIQPGELRGGAQSERWRRLWRPLSFASYAAGNTAQSSVTTMTIGERVAEFIKESR